MDHSLTGSVNVEIYRRNNNRVKSRSVKVQGGGGEGAGALPTTASFDAQELALEVLYATPSPRQDCDVPLQVTMFSDEEGILKVLLPENPDPRPTLTCPDSGKDGAHHHQLR